ncbi:MAG: UDP-2,3-diacylglucosamine diphosphatase LpxI [Rhodospirillaceae bacterium]
MSRLGIIAGGGSLPGQIISACRETGRDFFVLAFEGSADPADYTDVPIQWIRMAGLSGALEAARREGIEELVMVGRIPRPSIGELMRDVRSAKFLAKVGTRMLGDNSMLSALVKELEEAEGFRVVAPESLLVDILAQEGTYGVVAPDSLDRADIRRGIEVAREIGRLDIGQAAIVQNGMVLGVEAAEGTDRLIDRCAEFVRRDVPGGVLVKVAKPGQERRTDLPAIGATTVDRVAAAGLKGIAVEAKGALIVDRAATVRSADKAGVYVFGATAQS